ncbi:uncharacterized protein [Pagrus major]|uniref:uncharacterized protein n=1 Tax=Pagrus major TaxID=143350 RepID=UPI003CC8DE81
MADLLITCVSHHPVLFDKGHKNYKDNEFKDNVWQSIAEHLGYQDIEDAKRLWKNLRDTYVRKKREEKQTRSGQAGKAKKKWKYMDVMSFLDTSTAFRRVHSNLDLPQQDEEMEETGQESEESEGEAATAASAARAPKRRSRDLLQEYLERKEEREQQRAKEREERDDIHHFLMNLAPAMRRLSLGKQSWLKMKMQELVFQAEFGYSEPEHSQFTQL